MGAGGGGEREGRRPPQDPTHSGPSKGGRGKCGKIWVKSFADLSHWGVKGIYRWGQRRKEGSRPSKSQTFYLDQGMGEGQVRFICLALACMMYDKQWSEMVSNVKGGQILLNLKRLCSVWDHLTSQLSLQNCALHIDTVENVFGW